jgi:hypothetical protein
MAEVSSMKGIRKPNTLLCLLVFGMEFCSNDSSVQVNRCPAQIRGEAGEDRVFVESRIIAKVTRVAVECFPIDQPAVKVQGVERSATRTYELDATAFIKYQYLKDSDRYRYEPVSAPLGADLVFAALTPAGVAVEEASKYVSNVEGGATVSVKIAGSSADKVSKVSLVRASWK